MPTPSGFPQFDFSGGLQTATGRLLRKRNEIFSSKNADFSFKIGSITRRPGYEQVGQTLQYGNDSMGFHAFKQNSGQAVLLAAINDVNNVSTTIKFADVAGYWTNLTLPVSVDPYTKMQFVDSLNYSFVLGKSTALNTYMPLLSINNQLTVSNSTNVYNAPRGRFIASYNDALVVLNTQVNGVAYPNRFYISSPPTGAITFVQGPQQGLLTQLHVDSVRYIKPGMVLDIYSGGTFARQNTAISVIWVDKINNNFGFTATQINLQDRDEIWLTGKKGTPDSLSHLWNVDYPTLETADYVSIPSGRAESPAITGWGQNNNRFLVFTKDTMWKWDGANLINLSEQVGCVSHETIKTIGNWTIWLHYTGVWGYNDAFGQFKLLSRPIQSYIKAINPGNYSTASAVAADRKYKLAVGPIQVPDASTTSTSTSSTSTSSTSVSTSSTSTSSTSISSTSSSTSSTTVTTSTSSTSVSSTSSSISTSSTSSTSSSTSISTSSTTTTTTPTTLQACRLVYDFDMNIWSPEFHNRNIRYQIMHDGTGYFKPYFTDDTGKVFRDETGNSDGAYPGFVGDPIEFEIETGRTNFGSELVKNYIGAYISSENARGARIKVSVHGVDENPQYQNVGQITGPISQITFPANMTTGRDISMKINHMDLGDRPIIDGISWFSSQMESGFGRSVGKR